MKNCKRQTKASLNRVYAPKKAPAYTHIILNALKIENETSVKCMRIKIDGKKIKIIPRDFSVRRTMLAILTCVITCHATILLCLCLLILSPVMCVYMLFLSCPCNRWQSVEWWPMFATINLRLEYCVIFTIVIFPGTLFPPHFLSLPLFLHLSEPQFISIPPPFVRAPFRPHFVSCLRFKLFSFGNACMQYYHISLLAVHRQTFQRTFFCNSVLLFSISNLSYAIPKL